jgi:hypothetical protein
MSRTVLVSQSSYLSTAPHYCIPLGLLTPAYMLHGFILAFRQAGDTQDRLSSVAV